MEQLSWNIKTTVLTTVIAIVITTDLSAVWAVVITTDKISVKSSVQTREDKIPEDTLRYQNQTNDTKQYDNIYSTKGFVLILLFYGIMTPNEEWMISDER